VEFTRNHPITFNHRLQQNTQSSKLVFFSLIQLKINQNLKIFYNEKQIATTIKVEEWITIAFNEQEHLVLLVRDIVILKFLLVEPIDGLPSYTTSPLLSFFIERVFSFR